MLDRNTFMETLRSVAEIRRTSTDPLSKDEILKYFEGMEFNICTVVIKGTSLFKYK